MTDFKVGDRVRVSGQGAVWGGVGRITEWDGDFYDVLMESGPRKGQVGGWYPDTLELVPPEPYEPRDGDEITISTRGKVSTTGNGHGWNLATDKCNHWVDDFTDYEVTVHERGPEPKPKLPTTPGSVVRTPIHTYVRTVRGWMVVDVPHSKGDRYYQDGDFLNPKVIFDAGAK